MGRVPDVVGGGAEGAGADQHRLGAGAQKAHHEAVGLALAADGGAGVDALPQRHHPVDITGIQRSLVARQHALDLSALRLVRGGMLWWLSVSGRDPEQGNADSCQSQVRLLHPPCFQLGHQGMLGDVGPGDHQEPTRVAIQAMDDPRPLLTADAAEIGDVMEKGIHQGSARVARRRMDNHTGRLVDDDEVLVLIENRQRQCFG